MPVANTLIPDYLPDLSSAKALAIDTETFDPGIAAGLGPGVRRGGFIAGISVATDDGHGWYFPIAHKEGANMNKQAVLDWAAKTFSNPAQPKLFTNALYDLDYLAEAGVPVLGPIRDVQIAEPLLYEYKFSYSLESLAQQYLGEGKDGDDLWKFLANRYGGKATRKAQAGRIWEAPGHLVAPYAVSDVLLPFRIYQKQRERLKAEDLLTVFDYECRLVPILLAMRRRGVRVDLEAAHRLSEDLSSRIRKAERELWKIAGWEVSATAAADIGKLFDKLHIPYARTPKNNLPSITKEFLDSVDHPAAALLRSIRLWEHMKGTFIDGYIFNMNIKGRVHCEFNQLRGDEYGTVSGRFSSSNPNLQNIPSRDEEWAPIIRGLYVPEEGEDWCSDDWSQIEFRLLTHYARGKGADEARQAYRDNPRVDYHELTQEMIKTNAGVDLGRKPTKNVNFGFVYGMGQAKLMRDLKLDAARGKALFTAYHSALPFVKETFNHASRIAMTRGYVKTILGRRARFPFWEPADWDWKQGKPPSGPEAVMRETYKRIRRAHGHKALNRVLQGGSADFMKKAMVEMWEAGICDALGAPLITVHDELNWSRPRNPAALEAHREAVAIMERGDGLKIPLVVDAEVGPDWGHVE